VSHDKIGVKSQISDVDAWLNEMIDTRAGEFNVKFADGLNIAEKIEVVKFVNGLMKETLATPFVENGNLFGGFRWLTDM